MRRILPVFFVCGGISESFTVLQSQLLDITKQLSGSVLRWWKRENEQLIFGRWCAALRIRHAPTLHSVKAFDSFVASNTRLHNYSWFVVSTKCMSDSGSLLEKCSQQKVNSEVNFMYCGGQLLRDKVFIQTCVLKPIGMHAHMLPGIRACVVANIFALPFCLCNLQKWLLFGYYNSFLLPFFSTQQ